MKRMGTSSPSKDLRETMQSQVYRVPVVHNGAAASHKTDFQSTSLWKQAYRLTHFLLREHTSLQLKSLFCWVSKELRLLPNGVIFTVVGLYYANLYKYKPCLAERAVVIKSPNPRVEVEDCRCSSMYLSLRMLLPTCKWEHVNMTAFKTNWYYFYIPTFLLKIMRNHWTVS